MKSKDATIAGLALFRGKAASGFTLVELLVVMAIMGIMMSLLISGLGTAGSQRLVVGGNDLVSLTNVARQDAISKGTLVTLVMIASSGNTNWDRRVFCAMELTPPVPGSDTAPTWTPITKWVQLPDGISPDTSTDTFTTYSTALSLPAPLPAVTYQGTSVDAAKLAYISFLPDGRLLSTTSTTGNSFVTPPVLRLFNNATAASASASVKNYYQITFNSLTGVPIVDRP
jgi:prepilin-type N-terminal cleavage/methylation domain-containing protein